MTYYFRLTLSITVISLFFLLSNTLSYPYLYSLALVFVVLQMRFKNLNNIIISLFILFYFFVGLLNISTLRGNIESETLSIIMLYIFFILFPSWFYLRPNFSSKNLNLSINSHGYLFLLIHISIAYITLIYVYVSFGNVFLNQELRFYIPVWSGYVIRSILDIPLIMSICNSNNGKCYLGGRNISLLCYLPCLLIGARGTLITFLLTHLLCLYMSNQNSINGKIELVYRLSKTKIFFVFLSVVFVIISGFYLRRYNSDIFASPEELVSFYFDYDSFWIYLIMPFYFAFRETIGITNTIIINGLTNPLPIPLYFADLFTLLPGDYTAAGQTLGDIVGRVGDGGLTPGVIGGLYIDFSYFGVIWVLLISSSLAILYRLSYSNKKFVGLFMSRNFTFKGKTTSFS